MSKHETTNDGFYSKVIIAAIVVIWISLVGGNWLGHYVVEKGLLGKSAKQEYHPAVVKKPKPWIKVDPAQQQELEELQNGGAETEKPAEASSSPTPQASDTPSPETTASEGPAPSASATPAAAAAVEATNPAPEAQPVPEITPMSANPVVTPTSLNSQNSDGPPTPTPAQVSSAQGGSGFHLQFGSFENRENAQSLVDNLQSVGQEAEVEEFKSDSGKTLFRVRGGSYNEEQARQQRDKLAEQQFRAFIVSSH